MALKKLSLFSGIGGIDLAAQWAGIETVAFVEIDPFCQKVLKKHWPNVPIFDDIRKLNKEALEDAGITRIDIVAGGYPCQPFSTAGNRKGKDDDRHLWPEMFRIVSELRPSWVIGENVAGHVTLGLDDVLTDLDSIGYSTQAFIIPAAGVGARHRRDRVFTVGYTKYNGSFTSAFARVFNQAGNDNEERENATSQFKRTSVGSCSENVADTEGERCGKAWKHSQRPEERTSSSSYVCDSTSKGFPDRAAIAMGRSKSIEKFKRSDWWAVEPGVGRVANGIPGRVDRLKALGNAVVPQQIYPIFAAIAAIENGEGIA